MFHHIKILILEEVGWGISIYLYLYNYIYMNSLYYPCNNSINVKLFQNRTVEEKKIPR